MEEYKNTDGTYTSPRNGKTYKSEKAFRAHWFYKPVVGETNWHKVNKIICKCQYCFKKYRKSNIKSHETGCYLNPINKIDCKFCNKPILHFRTTKGTCSRSCSNSYFRTGINNGNYKTGESDYSVICYQFHEKKCVVCGEQDAVDVHHIDHNRNNNLKENLLPLCPTHHAYCHRGLYFKIKDKVEKYLKDSGV